MAHFRLLRSELKLVVQSLRLRVDGVVDKTAEPLKAVHSLGFRSRWGLVISIITISASLFISSCSTTSKQGFHESGRASWYGQKFHGRFTANGERFNMHELTAAHPSLAFGTLVQVKSMRTGKSVVVRINDRGPYVTKRIIDLSYAAAKALGMLNAGQDEVVLNQVAAR
ncbi:MAG: septal ring lytic transglycosylase RlpA family protein [Proteobacteria bacterium]|nr:MAG: septal ring lytic transglycosylase RlpA family protein [Pseudomonadota bacterium]